MCYGDKINKIDEINQINKSNIHPFLHNTKEVDLMTEYLITIEINKATALTSNFIKKI